MNNYSKDNIVFICDCFMTYIINFRYALGNLSCKHQQCYFTIRVDVHNVNTATTAAGHKPFDQNVCHSVTRRPRVSPVVNYVGKKFTPGS